MLGDGEGFAGQGALIDLNERLALDADDTESTHALHGRCEAVALAAAEGTDREGGRSAAERVQGSDYLAVSRNDGSLFENKDVARNDLLCRNLGPCAVADNVGDRSESLFELLDNVARLVLLHESDDGVEHEQADDDSEIYPFAEASGEADSDPHDVLDWPEKEGKKLEELVFALLGELVGSKLFLALGDLRSRQANRRIGAEKLGRHRLDADVFGAGLFLLGRSYMLGTALFFDDLMHKLVERLIIRAIERGSGRAVHRDVDARFGDGLGVCGAPDDLDRRWRNMLSE